MMSDELQPVAAGNPIIRSLMIRIMLIPFICLQLTLSGFSSVEAQAQPLAERYGALGKMLIIQSSAAMFPHADRESGHAYDGKLFPADLHYRDSSVAIFIPKGFRPEKTVDLVFYFHGWMNNIDSAFAHYRIVEQFSESNKNAVLVHPEGPKNAPDSFGGKLEESGTFRRLVNDVIATLRSESLISKNAAPGRIILAGHSGAYRVIAFILQRGGLTKNIQEVYLFDALYSETEKFAYWIDHSQGRLINIHTAQGGTRGESLNLLDDLQAWKIPVYAAPESTITADDLRKHRLLFIESDLTHSEVIFKRGQFREYLQTSALNSVKVPLPSQP